ncbi:MAG: glycosyltransferase [Chloroflexi bacterium]|nr:glycosyltransferase [Chloroflexota bacterium]
MDAREHFVLFHELLGVPWAKYRQLYFGADDRQFRREKYDHGKRVFRVLFYGKFQPLQGVEYIIKAAALLRDYRDVRFRVIGTGPDYPRVRTLAEQERLENVDFVDWVDFGRLPSEIAEADVCLGVFGTTGKVRRSIANKVIQALAVGRPVITARSPASEQLLTDEAEVLFCPPGDPAALAEAILRLRGDQALCDRLAEGGYLRYLRCCSPEAVGARAVEYLQGLARRTQVLADASRPQ